MTLNYIIVEVEETYNNTVDINGTKVQVNSTIESVSNVNRVATVVEAPSFVIVGKGDKIVVHHNIFREKISASGKKVKSGYHIDGNKYFVPLTEVFMYKQGDSEWKAINPYCFVKPIKKEENKVAGFVLTNNDLNSHKGMVKQKGIIVFPNDELISSGVNSGDEIIFSKYSEYEFELGGEIYYKMATKDILAII